MIRTALKSTVAASAIAGAALMSVPASAHADTYSHNVAVTIIAGNANCNAIAVYGVAASNCHAHL